MLNGRENPGRIRRNRNFTAALPSPRARRCYEPVANAEFGFNAIRGAHVHGHGDARRGPRIESPLEARGEAHARPGQARYGGIPLRSLDRRRLRRIRARKGPFLCAVGIDPSVHSPRRGAPRRARLRVRERVSRYGQRRGDRHLHALARSPRRGHLVGHMQLRRCALLGRRRRFRNHIALTGRAHFAGR